MACGQHLIEGWVNIDQAPIEGAIAWDVRNLEGLVPFGGAEIMYAGHVLEHIDRNDMQAVLNHWKAVMKPKGELYVSVPDFQALVERYQREGLVPEIQDPMMGGDESREAWSYHKCLFDFTLLAKLLMQAGFSDVSRYDPKSLKWHPQDWATHWFSLNCRAVCP